MGGFDQSARSRIDEQAGYECVHVAYKGLFLRRHALPLYVPLGCHAGTEGARPGATVILVIPSMTLRDITR
jgi:hypothetical protein